MKKPYYSPKIQTVEEATILRYRFDPGEIAYLEQFKWWNRDVEWLRDNFEKFHDIRDFLRLK